MKTRRLGLWAVLAVAAVFILVGAVLLNPPGVSAQQKKYHFVFLNQWGPSGAFPAVVQKGMSDAAAQLNVDAIMLFLPRDDDLAAQLASLEATLLKNPDGIITTIPHPTMFNKALQRALDKGIPVIASNTDALLGTGDPLEHKIPYIGSSLFIGGYELVRKAMEYFPDVSKVRALVGVESPGASWAEERAGGAIKFLEEKKIPYQKLDISQDMSTMQSRVAAFLKRNPDTNLVISQGGNGPSGTAKGVQIAGKKPGEVIVIGYDVTPQTAEEIKKGFVTFVNDQQPYLQGYLPVVQLYMIKEYAMSTWDVNTGLGYVDKNTIEKVGALAQKRVR